MKIIYSFKTTVMKKFLSIIAVTAVFAVGTGSTAA
jgi:hypothetical protein